MAFNPLGLLSRYGFAPAFDDSAYPQPLQPPRGLLASASPMMLAINQRPQGVAIEGGSSSHPPRAVAKPTSLDIPLPPPRPAEFSQPATSDSAASPTPDAQPEGEPSTGGFDSVANGLKNLYGAGGPGDPLISIGMGLLSQRGVGRGLAAGMQNMAAMSEIANQRQRQATLDKLALERENRQIAWQNYLKTRQADQDALDAKRFDADQAYRTQSLGLSGARLNEPQLQEKRIGPGQAQKFWIKPGETEGVPFGQPYAVNNPEDGLLSSEAVDSMAGRILAGEKNVMTGLGRGAQGAENIRRVQEAVAKRNPEAGAILNKQIEALGQGAEARTLGTQEANAISAGTEALGALQIGRDVSAKLSRGNYVPVNMAIQAWQKGTSNPELAAYGRAMHTIANTYARAVNPKGLPHEKVVEDTVKSLSSAQGPDALNAMLDVMQREIEMAQKSPAQARQTLKDLREGKTPATSTTTRPNFPSWSIEP
jgi:hypothetical protein